MREETTPAKVLETVLTTTKALEAALDPLDVDAFELALAARADALKELGAVAAGAAGPILDPALALLAEEAVASDARARTAASSAMEELRRQMRELSGAQRVLSGYRGYSSNPPRFADRRG